jgi:hypothetical protein
MSGQHPAQETEEFHRLNTEAWATRDALPWWLRLVIR